MRIMIPTISQEMTLLLAPKMAGPGFATMPDGNWQSLSGLAIGQTLAIGGEAAFRISGTGWLELNGTRKPFPQLEALRPLPAGEYDCAAQRPGWSLASITLSDKGWDGLREDTAGPLILETLRGWLTVGYHQGFLIPDDLGLCRGLVAKLALIDKYSLIVTTGGTGLSPRDVTPQAVEPLLDLRLPGFSGAMLARSLEKTVNAAISRQVCGVIGNALFISLPGSAKAVRENLEAIAGAINHALAKINGDEADCGGSN